MFRKTLVAGLVAGVAVMGQGCSSGRQTSIRPPPSGSASDDGLAPATKASTFAPIAVPEVPPPPPVRVAPPCAATPDPCSTGCIVPCDPCRPRWHARAVGGFAYWMGEDSGEECAYFGADLGRKFCNSCWSVDAFWRTQSAQFPRDPSGEDGGTWNHVGVKASHERSLGGGRWFAWAGAGPEYFWTSDYVNDDSGLGVFAEAGIGYIVNRNWRIRAGVDVHGMNTDAGRRSIADDGDSRWLWVVSPVIGLEFDF